MKTRREFLEQSALMAGAALVPDRGFAQHGRPKRPNIILVLVDDMGFSDIGCYGSEIKTPNLDRLAGEGLRFTQFYNNPRCCPSRACLMTGLYPHQAGMGLMVSDYQRYPYPAYAGDLSQDCVTIAEALKSGGYQTAMVGKWHLTPDEGVTKHNWPLQRGFERYYGTIVGATNYYNPATLTRDNSPIQAGPDYYYTDALAENAAQYVGEMARGDAPFFLYAAFTAAHWPLHAPEADVAKYRGRYSGGWDATRRERHRRQIEMGIVDLKWGMTDRDQRVPPWEIADYKDWEQRRMEVYAAQLSKMDEGIGTIMAKVREMGVDDDTLFLFMSDNGGNFEEMGIPRAEAGRPLFIPYKTRDGRDVELGNDPAVMPGPETTYQSYGIPWGNVSNTPFRLYKHYAHEGGISTPLLAHWPAGIKGRNILTHEIGHETDIMATCLDVAGVAYPSKAKSGATPPALVGSSLLPVFRGGQRDRAPIFWEHEGNSAMRDGKWKLVSRFPDAWELYDMEADRTEMHDLADTYPKRLEDMAARYQEWAKKVGVRPWPMPETPEGSRDGAMDTPTYLRRENIGT